MERELQIARNAQMGLMPKTSPRIEEFELAARCVPAAQVCGDFFQYFHQADTLSLSMADVTGHAMEAAIPVVPQQSAEPGVYSGLLLPPVFICLLTV
jgi:serine phosphatase RsbU (regulator of sigma subunit)